MLNWHNLERSGNPGAHKDAATMSAAQFPKNEFASKPSTPRVSAPPREP
jgi:hypothetical protein